MKKISSLLCSLTLLFFVSCGGNENKEESTTTTDTTASATAGTASTDTATMGNQSGDIGKDKDFLMEAAKGGMMEVEAGKIAAKNGASAAVKQFGQQMVTDHTKANNDLKDVAAKLNISIPTALDEDGQKHLDEMSKMKGKDFDKHYVDMMVDDHDTDVSKFEDMSQNATNADVKAFAAKTLPVLKGHQEKIKSIKESMKD